MRPWMRAVLIAATALAAAAAAVFVAAPLAQYGKASALQDKGDVAGAYEALDRMGGYRNAIERKAQLQAGVVSSRSAETMDFGGYSWLVLEERGGRALLLLKDVLEPRPYNEALTDTGWEACTLRAYLNGTFYNSFSAADRARIIETAVINSNNAQTGAKAGNDTRDYIFLLSLAEAKLYFTTDSARAARDSRGTAAWWWLRSPGLEPMLAATVGSDGAPGYAGSGVNYTTRGVRPAMWVAIAQAA